VVQVHEQTRQFGALLREHRLAAGLTQEALAERSRLSVRAVADLERGVRRYPYADTLDRLAAALELTPEQRAALAAAGRRPTTPVRSAHVMTQSRQLTSFVGREAEIGEVCATAHQARLITLLGPAGVGKTRLAIEAAQKLAEHDFDALHFVDLAPISNPELVEQTVIIGLGGRQRADRTPLQTIASLLGDGPSLVVLDNCEHVIEVVSRLVDAMLRQVRGTCVIATSREPLGVAGEARWPVPPLGEVDSGRLFTERARLINRRFVPSPRTDVAIVQLCHRLDGLPLAIELAAARVGQLPVEEILARLEQPFSLLSRGNRTEEPRHQSLEAAIKWSHDLLDVDERRAFAGLSVFAGGFDVSAAEVVGPCSFDTLGQLANKSMVVAGTGVDGRARYGLLETLRQYAHARLEESGDALPARRRHFQHYAALTSSAARELRGPHQGLWVERLHEELDNLRAALEWGSTEDPVAALTMAVGLDRFWARSQPLEGRQWLLRLVAVAPGAPATLLAAARTAAADFAADVGQPQVGRAELEQVLHEWRGLEDPAGIARCLTLFALSGTGTTVLAERRAMLDEAVAQARRSTDRPVLTEALIFLGVATNSSGQRVLARKYLEEAVATARSVLDLRTLALALQLLGQLDEIEHRLKDARVRHAEALEVSIEAREPRLQTHSHIHLGMVSLAEGKDDESRWHFEASLAVRQVGYHQCGAILGLAQLAARAGRLRRALELFGAASLNDWDTVLYRTSYADMDIQPWIGDARQTLGSENVDAAWHAGAALSPEQAAAFALSDAATTQRIQCD
jgi:predicted ATPase